MVERTALDYTEGLTATSMSALLELNLILHSYSDSIVLVGGWVPYLLIKRFGRSDFNHVGSIDIDLAVNPEAIDDNAYAEIVDLIEAKGYQNRVGKTGETILYSFEKDINSPQSGNTYPIQVDFLTPPTPESGSHRHERVQPSLPARIAKGSELAFRFNMNMPLQGILPNGAETESEIPMLDIPGCLGMKGIVLGERYKEKDAYDIFTVIGQCLESPEEVAETVTPNLSDPLIREGMNSIRQKFKSIRAEGPSWVADFLETDPEMKDRVKAESFVTVDKFLTHLE